MPRSLSPLKLEHLQRQSINEWMTSPRGDPALVPLSKLVQFLDLAQDSEGDAELAVSLGRHILEIEPTNKLVLDHMPIVQNRLKLQTNAEETSDEEDNQADQEEQHDCKEYWDD